MFRFTIRDVLWLTVVVAAIGMTCSYTIAQEERPAVSLILSGASGRQRTQEILFACDVVLVNAGEKELVVRSKFNSAFDGLQLVVTDGNGIVLAEQGFTFHQSPHSKDRAFTIARGSTKGQLVFPIRGLPVDSKTFKVRLVGVLPGSDYKRLLSSDTIEVTPTRPNRP